MSELVPPYWENQSVKATGEAGRLIKYTDHGEPYHENQAKDHDGSGCSVTRKDIWGGGTQHMGTYWASRAGKMDF